jgi:hypothetical protein
MRCARTTRGSWVAVVLVVAGCGGGSTGEIIGTVTFDGTPIENGWIDFIPADGQGPTKGAKIEGGKFTVKDVPVGTAKVMCSSFEVFGEEKLYNTPNSPTKKKTRELLPEKYSDRNKTEVRYDVTAGHNEKNFELTK